MFEPRRRHLFPVLTVLTSCLFLDFVFAKLGIAILNDSPVGPALTVLLARMLDCVPVHDDDT